MNRLCVQMCYNTLVYIKHTQATPVVVLFSLYLPKVATLEYVYTSGQEVDQVISGREEVGVFIRNHH